MAKSENVEHYCGTCSSAEILSIQAISAMSLHRNRFIPTHSCTEFEGLYIKCTDQPLTQRSLTQDDRSCHSAVKLATAELD